MTLVPASSPEPVEGKVVDAGLPDCVGCLLPQDDLHRPGCPLSDPHPHEVETGETRGGLGYARCRCGEWEAIVTGPRSARWALQQYREHLRAVGLG